VPGGAGVTGSTELPGAAALRLNRSYFESAFQAAEVAARRGAVDHALEWAKLAAEIAWVMHPGFYAYPPLESLLRSVGEGLTGSPGPAPTLPPRRKGSRSWLHLLTAANLIGGHTRLAERLIVNAAAGTGDQHSVLLIDQGADPIPEWLGEAARQTGGALLVLPEQANLAERALLVREVASRADALFLHVHPNDPVAPVAFAAAGGPPVVYVNHADHVFWAGAACADLVADLRPEGEEITRERRGAVPSLRLPIPLDVPAAGPSREEARRALGLGPEQVALLAIASAYKFAPYRHLQFQETAAELLRRHESAVLLVVGPSESDPVWREAVAACRGRLRLFGVQPDVARFYAAADLCLESFPLGSLTSTLDAMLLGVPVLRAPKGVPLFSLSAYPGLLPAASSREEYLEQASRYLADPQLRVAAAAEQRESVLRRHTAHGWRSAWDALIAALPESHRGTGWSGAGWDRTGDLDGIWAELQESSGPRKFSMFRRRARAVVRSRPRGEIARLWLSAVARGDWRLARILPLSIVKG
jgi:hypothetical protein